MPGMRATGPGPSATISFSRFRVVSVNVPPNGPPEAETVSRGVVDRRGT